MADKPTISKTKRLLNLAKTTGERIKSRTDLGLCNYSIIFSDETTYERIADGCYGTFAGIVNPNYGNGYANKKVTDKLFPVFMVDWQIETRGGPMTDEMIQAHEAWIKYVVLESPYAHVFVSKNVKKYRTTPSILRLSVTPQEVIAAAQLMRMRAENHSIIMRWYLMQKQGLNKTVALYLASQSATGGNGSGKWFQFGTQAPHFCIDGSLTVTGLKNFLDKEVQIVAGRKTVREGNFHYSSLMSAWDPKSQNTYGAITTEAPKLPKANGSTEVKNGWGGVTIKHGTIKFEEVVTIAKEFLSLNGLKETYADA